MNSPPAGYPPIWRRRVVRLAAFILYSVALLVSTHWPQPPGLVSVSGLDKLLHIAAYFVWTVLFLLALSVHRRPGRSALVGALVGMALAALDEWTQSIPGINRSTDALDWAADAAGVLAGVSCWLAARAIRAKLERS